MIKVFATSECECCHRTETRESDPLRAASAGDVLKEALEQEGWRILRLTTEALGKHLELEHAAQYWLCSSCVRLALAHLVQPLRDLIDNPRRALQLERERLEHVATVASAIIESSAPPASDGADE